MIRCLSPYFASLWLISLSLVGMMQAVAHHLPSDTIAFESGRGGVSDIYLIDAGRGQMLNLTRDPPRNFAPVWSPDGSKLVYLTTREMRLEIRVLDVETGEHRYLTDQLGLVVFAPQWSRDNRRIVLTTDHDIYLADTDAGTVRNLSQHPADDNSPVWSPDEQHIAFVSHRDGNDEIYLVNVVTGALSNLTHRLARDVSPAWSPDGTQIAFLSYDGQSADIYTLNLNTGQLRNLTANPANDFMPSWSPDGQIRFLSNRDGGLAYYRMNWDGSNVQRLFRIHILSTDLHWSPDGTHVVYVAEPEIDEIEIYMAGTGSPTARNVSGARGWDVTPVWSPDSRQIAFTSMRDGNTEIYVLDIQTLALRNLSNHSASDSSPVWRPSQ